MNINELIDRQEGEDVVYFLRRHWIVYLADLALIAVLAVVPLGAVLLSTSVWPGILDGPVSRPLLALLAGAYYLMIWLFFIADFVDYYLDTWIVTNRRIVDVQQHNLFSRTISELDLSKVQDVTSEVKGVVPSILNYGNVMIQTAGEVEHFSFQQVHRPHEIRKHILELVKADQKQELSALREVV